MRSPEELGEAEIRRFLLHQIQVEELSHSTYRQVLAALKFLYTVPRHRPWSVGCLPFPRRGPRKLPTVLTSAEITALFAAFRRPMYRALFMNLLWRRPANQGSLLVACQRYPVQADGPSRLPREGM
jgi:hypothetical protein